GLDRPRTAVRDKVVLSAFPDARLLRRAEDLDVLVRQRFDDHLATLLRESNRPDCEVHVSQTNPRERSTSSAEVDRGRQAQELLPALARVEHPPDVLGRYRQHI